MQKFWFLLVAPLVFGIGGWWGAVPVQAASQQSTADVQLVPDPNIEPVDPQDPDGSGKPFPGDPEDPDNPGTGSRGHLTLDYLSNLKFKQQRIANGFIEATATNQHAFVQISDRRGTGGGWNLMLKPEALVGQSDHQSLKSATVTLGAANFRSSGSNVSRAPDVTVGATQALPVGEYSLIGQAQNVPGNRQGVGTWLLRLNTQPSAPTQLNVLAAAVTSTQTYEGTLSWMLTDTPQ